jgi:hypothetical protein
MLRPNEAPFVAPGAPNEADLQPDWFLDFDALDPTKVGLGPDDASLPEHGADTPVEADKADANHEMETVD